MDAQNISHIAERVPVGYSTMVLLFANLVLFYLIAIDSSWVGYFYCMVMNIIYNPLQGLFKIPGAAAGHLPDGSWVPDGTELLFIPATRLFKRLMRKGLGPRAKEPETLEEKFEMSGQIYMASRRYKGLRTNDPSPTTSDLGSGSSSGSSSLSSSPEATVPTTPPEGTRPTTTYIHPPGIVDPVPPSQELPAASAFEALLTRAVAAEEAERNPLGEHRETEGNYNIHTTYYDRPIWNLEGERTAIETVRHDITPTQEGGEVNIDALYQCANGVQMRSATGGSPGDNGIYSRVLRVEVQYEGGKRDVYRSLQQWVKVMIEWLQRYQDKEGKYTGPIVTNLRIEQCNHMSYNLLRLVGYRVRASHGFPSIIEDTEHIGEGGLARMDLMRTIGTCAMFGFFIWRSLATGLFNLWRTYDDMREAYKEFKLEYKARSSANKGYGLRGFQWCTDDFKQLCPGATLLQYFEDDELHMEQLRNLELKDFNGSVCHLLISKTMHASVIWPMVLLSKMWQRLICNKMERTYDRRIVPKDLTNTTKTRAYKHMNTLDIECLVTKSGVHLPQLLCARYTDAKTEERVKLVFTSEGNRDPIDLFIRWVLEQDVSIEFWVHNLAYDGAFFSNRALKYCNSFLVHPVRLLSNSHGLILSEFHLHNRRILKLRDSFKHLPLSLNELGLSFLNRGKDELDVLSLKSPHEFWTKKCISYCFNDCDLLEGVLHKYQAQELEHHGLNPLRYVSISSYTKSSFIHGPLGLRDTTVQLYTLAPKVDEFIRRGAHGGTTEALHIGTVKVDDKEGTMDSMYLLDHNSMYPWMMTQDLPHGKPRYIGPAQCISTHSLNTEELVQWLHTHRGFYNIYIESEPLDLRHKLFGPADTSHILYAEETDTIVCALRLGYKLKLLHGYTFDYGSYMSEWIKHRYKDKEEATIKGDKVRRLISKLILTNVYGAFGTKWKGRVQHVTYGSRFIKQLHNNETIGMSEGTVVGTKWRIEEQGRDDQLRRGFELEDNIAIGQEVPMERDWTTSIWCGTETTDAIFDDINVAISSCITSRARLKLYQTTLHLEAHGLNVLYKDTDCYIVRAPKGLPSEIQSLIHPTRLGALKVEAQIGSVTIQGPKAYTYTTSRPTLATTKTPEPTTTSRLKGIRLRDIEASGTTIPNVLNSLLRGEDVQIRTNKIYKPKSNFFSRLPITTKTVTHTLRGIAL
jgi:hypothetical protein